ncbi:MAG: flagellar basal body rod protein FlgB [Burkholderiaceae bacterium]|nr:flagellar basal body rod protein FlgB [Rhodoferax sp.]MCP5263168.1 flagellar basal body rod protein FlgB [Rhodoferax sp.]MCW5628759.1 flagellar basal body rod protein FlgB [Rhodoferax sp.]
MFAQLTAGLDFQATALGVRSERQRVIASNIANADTPGYVARDIDFKQAMAEATGGQPRLAPSTAGAPRAHPAHFALPGANGHIDGTPAELGYTVQTQPAMDNNTVDLDRERANFVDNAVRYESTLRFINGYSRTILSAIQGQ